jgi:hypothetical protein
LFFTSKLQSFLQKKARDATRWERNPFGTPEMVVLASFHPTLAAGLPHARFLKQFRPAARMGHPRFRWYTKNKS